MQPTNACPCGRAHTSPTRVVLIGAEASHRLSEICNGYSCILVVADRHTYAACGARVVEQLGARVLRAHIFEDEVLIPNEAALAALESCLDGVDHLVGIGSGVINDLCKQVAHQNGLRYTVVATAPSMDGYASAGTALILGGMKVTLAATPPEVIVADTDVLVRAPMDMIRAGYGDIIGKYSCLCDWRLAAYVRGEYICPAVWQWVKDTADRVRSLADGICRREPQAIEALMRALVDVGVAMAYVGNSRPASGSEHHIAHFLEITGILRHRPYLAHGVDVACGSVLTARLRERIRNGRASLHPHDPASYAAAVKTVFGGMDADGRPTDGIAAEVMDLQARTGFYEDAERADFILQNEAGIAAILADTPSEAETREMVEAVGLSFDDFVAFYGEDTLREAVTWGKDLKDRYTVLWLYHQFYGNL